MNKLKDKVAIVTRASKGSGAGIARQHAADGAKVIETDGTHAAGVIGSEFQTWNENQTPLGRIGQVRDIAQGPLQASGQYKDIDARRAGRWAFVERRFTMHFATPLKDWTPATGTERFGLNP